MDNCECCKQPLVYWLTESGEKTGTPDFEGPYGEHSMAEHPGLCCDCFDSAWLTSLE